MNEEFAELLGERAPIFIAALQKETALRGGVLDPDGVSAVLPDGMLCNFGNLARTVAILPEELIEQQVANFFAGLDTVGDPAELSWEELRPKLKLQVTRRILEESELSINLAEDLACRVVVDYENMVLSVNKIVALNVAGHTAEELIDLAIGNTKVEAQSRSFYLASVEEDWIQLSSKWHFTSSLALFPREVLAGLLHKEYDEDRGILLALPTRYDLFFASLTSGGALLRNIQALTPRLLALQSSAAGAITPNIYHYWKDSLQRVSFFDSAGRQLLKVSDEVVQLMEKGLI